MDKKKINLSFISRLALWMIILLVGGSMGFVMGKYDTKNVKEFVLGAKNELSKDGGQTIERTKPKNKDVNMDLFWMVWDKLEENYLFPEDIDYDKMIEGATVGMTEAVGDPYTAYFPPQENQTFNEQLNGAFYGVGIQLGYALGNQLAVIAPLAGMPGEKAGIKAGDYILKIVDEQKGIDVDTYGMSLQEAIEKIRGEKGTKVKLTLLHEGGNETYEVEIVREEIVTPSVEVKFGQVINGSFTTEATASGGVIAYLRLSRFGELTDDQWDQEVGKILERNDVDGVILDVRNNPGGLVTAAVNLAAEFLPRDTVVVNQEQRGQSNKEFKTKRIGRLLDMPLVVLMNKGSASASEIIAGALREHKRAKLVGDTSFGKGTMQLPVEIEGFENASLHVTTSRWLTPDGNWIHKKGIDPDVKVELDENNPTLDTQLLKAGEMITSGEWKVE